MFPSFTLSLLSRAHKWAHGWEREVRIRASIAAAASVTLIAVACGGGDPTATAEGFGTVQGTVWFVGAPCPPELSDGPPCDGPYPNYDVRILRAGDESVAAIQRTDANGQYVAVLPAGRYVLRTRAGISADTFEETRFTVIPGDTLTLQLTVDTGIR